MKKSTLPTWCIKKRQRLIFMNICCYKSQLTVDFIKDDCADKIR